MDRRLKKLVQEVLSLPTAPYHEAAVGALAFPLGNYHNLGRRWPAAEYISASDMEGMVALCTALALNPPAGETRMPMKKRFAASFRSRRKRLLG